MCVSLCLLIGPKGSVALFLTLCRPWRNGLHNRFPKQRHAGSTQPFTIMHQTQTYLSWHGEWWNQEINYVIVERGGRPSVRVVPHYITSASRGAQLTSEALGSSTEDLHWLRRVTTINARFRAAALVAFQQVRIKPPRLEAPFCGGLGGSFTLWTVNVPAHRRHVRIFMCQARYHFDIKATRVISRSQYMFMAWLSYWGGRGRWRSYPQGGCHVCGDKRGTSRRGVGTLAGFFGNQYAVDLSQILIFSCPQRSPSLLRYFVFQWNPEP